MPLRFVTVTGADDSVRPQQLVDLSKKYPWVEWGLLLSKTSTGGTRFPSYSWLRELEILQIHRPDKINLCGHLCGRWVRDLCKGNWTFITDRGSVWTIFDRYQLNFHAMAHTTDALSFVTALKGACKQFIFQVDGAAGGDLMEIAIKGGVDAVPLFDLSGGAGDLPATWPSSGRPLVGYAGGLSPDNILEQRRKIALAAGDADYWIDLETHVRSNNDQQFDLDKVEYFLQRVEPFVDPGKEAGNGGS